MITQSSNEQLLDHFAGIALAALIRKSPFLDLTGEQGKKVEPEEMQRIKKELTGAAYEYASYMLIAKKENLEWLDENKESLANSN